MALQEGTALVPGALGSYKELTSELAQSDVAVLQRLRGYASIVSQHAKTDRRNALTLELLRQEGELTVSVHETLAEAEARLTELEARDDPNLDVVLVNIARISQLQDAYPNYYADTSRFASFVQSQIGIDDSAS
ncbi:hypothetical protein MPSYJ_04050 [Mycolicibacterium psychrotolerans]|uniref:Uncharacterized protein n=1 Tax=Mycolicibacterium psychrotolerans TaxID=216929 RepID=A0A7I7M469_9MYCO|nr:hypothetical protein MPSYJ_04050 [Mycolicibacterium psychrotolerans]